MSMLLWVLTEIALGCPEEQSLFTLKDVVIDEQAGKMSLFDMPLPSTLMLELGDNITPWPYQLIETNEQTLLILTNAGQHELTLPSGEMQGEVTPLENMDASQGWLFSSASHQVVVFFGFTSSQMMGTGAGMGPVTGCMQEIDEGWVSIGCPEPGGPARPNYVTQLTELPGRVLISDGFNGPRLLDIERGTWLSLPAIRYAFVRHQQVAFSDHEVMFASQVLAAILDVDTGSWRLIADPPRVHRRAHLVRRTDGTIFLIGDRGSFRIGERGTMEPPEVWSYVAADDRWQEEPSPAIPRRDFSVAVSGDGIAIVGGRTNHQALVDVVELLRPNTQNWVPAGTLCVPRAHPLLLDTTHGLIVAGGDASVIEPRGPNSYSLGPNEDWQLVELLER